MHIPMTSVAELLVLQAEEIKSTAKSTAKIKHYSTLNNDFLDTTTGVYITIHGHFYQPPRENPDLDTIERQPTAAPFHDWNERIYYECYRPNAFARVLNDQGEVIDIVNNYEYLSFNIGPTLMSWLEDYDLEVYQRILEADQKSCVRLNGHGNAIAQVYNHIILPLANERDKYTQIRWGKADFRSRFGREPEGMWLAETAVDYLTLEALVAEDIRFIILAPSQAQRCRPIPSEHTSEHNSNSPWQEVGGAQIDPTRPYRCFLKNGKFIDIFFYDGPISRDMGFNDLLSSTEHFAKRLGQAVRGDHRSAQLIAVATDGETFGHHKTGTEKCIAYAFTHEFPQRNWTVTNFAHYLSFNPPTWEVVLKPVTAWSCSHGVDRWQDDCGCGGDGKWHQMWRRPLRNALNWLRDQLIQVYQETGSQFFHDPWLARDEYIQVIRNRSPANVDSFLERHSTHPLTTAQQVDALRLLEMQHHALLMYTSCGWFFEEISRLEGVQILRYAARAIQLAGDVAKVQLEEEFIQRLALAPSNVECFKTGDQIYRQLVLSAQVSWKQVVADYAITSLFKKYSQEDKIYCYYAHQQYYQLKQIGALTLAVGQLQLASEITRESGDFVFALLYLGAWDFHCCIQPLAECRGYRQRLDTLFNALDQGSAADTILVMNQLFGQQHFNLQHLFSEERYRIMQLLTQETLTRLDQLYTEVYRDNYRALIAFHQGGLSVPKELQVAAEIAISNHCITVIRALDSDSSDQQVVWSRLAELEAIATAANHLHCQLDTLEVKQTLEKLILRTLWQILYQSNPEEVEVDIQRLEKMIDVGNQLNLTLSLDRCQELYWQYFHNQLLPQLIQSQDLKKDSQNKDSDSNGSYLWLCKMCTCSTSFSTSVSPSPLLNLGQTLAVDLSGWITNLPSPG